MGERVKRGDWVMVVNSSLRNFGPLKLGKCYQVIALMHKKDSDGFPMVKIQYLPHDEDRLGVAEFTTQVLVKIPDKCQQLARLLYG